MVITEPFARKNLPHVKFPLPNEVSCPVRFLNLTIDLRTIFAEIKNPMRNGGDTEAREHD